MNTISKIPLFMLLLAWPGAVFVHAQSTPKPTAIYPSPAHEASRAFVIDPQYDALAVKPLADVKPDAVPWIYGDGQLEAWKINQLVTEGFKASKNVDYEKNYGRVAARCLFRHLLPVKASKPARIRCNGSLVARIGQQVLLGAAASAEAHTLTIPADVLEGSFLEIAVTA
jgi:hypothetical protein